MSEQNGTGAAQPLLPYVTELVTTSGVTIWVRPVSINDQQLIIEQMNKQYPAPQERDFKILVPSDQATYEGQTMTDIETYKEAVKQSNITRNNFWLRAHVMTCVDFPEGVDVLIDRYLPEIQRKRKFLNLPDDDLEAVIFHSIITTPNDIQQIRGAIEKTLPVEVSEVTAQLRIFRPVIERRVDPALSNGRKTSSRSKLVQE